MICTTVWGIAETVASTAPSGTDSRWGHALIDDGDDSSDPARGDDFSSSS